MPVRPAQAGGNTVPFVCERGELGVPLNRDAERRKPQRPEKFGIGFMRRFWRCALTACGLCQRPRRLDVTILPSRRFSTASLRSQYHLPKGRRRLAIIVVVMAMAVAMVMMRRNAQHASGATDNAASHCTDYATNRRADRTGCAPARGRASLTTPDNALSLCGDRHRKNGKKRQQL